MKHSDPDRRQTVALIRELAGRFGRYEAGPHEGRYRIREIVDELNRLGIPTRSGEGRWSTEKVRRLLAPLRWSVSIPDDRDGPRA